MDLWVGRTVLQAQGPSDVWTGPSAPTPGQRFYRALSVAAPADTNLVFIQPGTFTMGSPTNEVGRYSDETQDTVTISRGFWMGQFLVTQGDYLAVVGSGLHSGQANFDGQYEYDASVCAINTPSGIFLGITTRVGSHGANAWGLYDMIGNMWEWCQDRYGAHPPGIVVDPRGSVTGSYGVIRGGSWSNRAAYCRSAIRNGGFLFAGRFSIGSRVLLALG